MAQPQMTGLVQPGSTLERNEWVVKGMIQASANAIWTPWISNKGNGLINQAWDFSAGESKVVTMDYDGHLVGTPVQGKEVALGRGETKRKFSNNLTIDYFRFTVDNGRWFDATKIDATKLTSHTDSRNKLADLWIRWRDQWIFDMMQGFTENGDITYEPSHQIVIDGTAGFGYNEFIAIGNIVKLSRFGRSKERDDTVSNFDSEKNFVKISQFPVRPLMESGGYGKPVSHIYVRGKKRTPLKAYTKQGEQPCWYLFVDDTVKAMMLRDPALQRLLRDTEPRGNNRLMTPMIGKIGNIKIVEMPTHFGTSQKLGDRRPKHQSVEMAGMRQFKVPLTTVTTSAGTDTFVDVPKANKYIGGSINTSTNPDTINIGDDQGITAAELDNMFKTTSTKTKRNNYTSGKGAIGRGIVWSGEQNYDNNAVLEEANTLTFARCFLVGEGCLNMALGKAPEYKMAISADYGETSESMLAVFMHLDKIRLKAENDDYEAAPVANFDWGIITVDIRIA